jgi:predicted RND superfamily exporter protein
LLFTCKAFKPLILNDSVAVLQLRRLKLRADVEKKREKVTPDVDMFELYDDKFQGDDCIAVRREGDVSDGFFAEEIKKYTKVQEWRYEV